MKKFIFGLMAVVLASVLMIGIGKAASGQPITTIDGAPIDDSYEIKYNDLNQYVFFDAVAGNVNNWSLESISDSSLTGSAVTVHGDDGVDKPLFRVTIPQAKKQGNLTMTFLGKNSLRSDDGNLYNVKITVKIDSADFYTWTQDDAMVSVEVNTTDSDTIFVSINNIWKADVVWSVYGPNQNGTYNDTYVNKKTAYIFENGINDTPEWYQENTWYTGYRVWHSIESMEILSDNNYLSYPGQADNATEITPGASYSVGGLPNFGRDMILDRRTITQSGTKFGERIWRQHYIPSYTDDASNPGELTTSDESGRQAYRVALAFFRPKVETPAPKKSVSQEDITNLVKEDRTYKYTIEQEVPRQHRKYFYKSFKMTDNLKNVLTSTAVKVYQDRVGGTEVTSWFDITTGQTPTATLKAANNKAAFYGHKYYFVIDTKVKSGLTSQDVEQYRKGTVYEVPNTANITFNDYNNQAVSRNTNTVHVYWYRGMCPGGDCSNCEGSSCTEPDLKPTKTVSSKYINNTTKFDYRVSQYVPGYNADYLWTELTLKDTIDNAYDMSKTTVKVISSRYGENRDLSKGNDAIFDVTISGHTITATAKAAALQTEGFYGNIGNDGKETEHLTYTMVITTQVTEGFNFTNYSQQKQNCTTVDGNEVCETVYTVVNNKATRVFGDKHNNKYNGQTPNVPTTQVDPKIPNKEVDTSMIKYGEEFNYTITTKVQPAGYQKSVGEATQEENSPVYFDSWVFTDTLEAPLQIQDASKVKVTQSTSGGTETDYTNKFNIVVSGNTITATLKNPKDPNFYGTRGSNDTESLKTYKFKLTVSLRENAENVVDMSKYVMNDGEYFIIPNKGAITTKIPGNTPVTKETNNVNVYYYPDKAPVKDVEKENITSIYEANKTFTYNIEKTVLSYTQNLWYTSFVFEDVLEDCLEATNNLAIKNEAGTDVTNWFDISVDGQKISATLKNANNKAAFYGHTYNFIITTKVKEKYNLDKWKQGKQYVIPNIATFTYDNKITEKTNEKKVYIDPKVTTVPVPKTAANIPLSVLLMGTSLVLVGIAGYMYLNRKKRSKKA